MRYDVLNKLLKPRFVAVGLLSTVMTVMVCGSVFADSVEYRRGKEAYQAGRFMYAAKHFNDAVKNDPNDTYARFYFGLALTRLKKTESAKQQFQQVVEIENMKQFANTGERPNQMLIDKANKNIAVITRKQIQTTAGSQKAKAIVNNHAGKSDNYLTHALQRDGKVVHWNLSKMPLKVFIKSGYGVPGWDSSMIPAVYAAYGEWYRASKYKISFKTTKNRDEADIVVGWQAGFDEHAGRVGENAFESINGTIVRSDISIATQHPAGRPLTMDELKHTAIHELGHALGIQGHSPNPGDVMFFSQNPSQSFALTPRDKRTIQLLYQQEADITNSVAASTTQVKEFYTLMNKGNAVMKQDPAKAYAYYAQARQIDPNNADAIKNSNIARYNMGVAAIQQGVAAAQKEYLVEARQAFESAVSIFEGLMNEPNAPAGVYDNLNKARYNLRLVNGH